MRTDTLFFDIGDTLVFDHPPLPERVLSASLPAEMPLDPARFPAAFRVAEAFAVQQYVAGIAWDAPGALRETVGVLLRALGCPPPGDAQWSLFAAAFRAAPFVRRVHPDAFALLIALKRRGFVLGAISDWEETLPDLLAELGLRPYFETLSVSALVGAAKPGARLFQDALRQAGKAPDHCLHVGDWYELDVAGARAAGMQTLLFDWAGRRPDTDCPRVASFPALADYLLALPAPREEEQLWGGSYDGT